MKKHILFGGLLLSMMALTSCNGNYDDWASPQQYAQDNAISYGIKVTPGVNINTVMPVTNDTLHIASFAKASDSIASLTLKYLKIGNDTIKARVEGNNIYVSANDLDSVACAQNKSRASVARTISVTPYFKAKLITGNAIEVKGTVEGSLKPEPTPAIDESGYCLLGDVAYGWDPTKPLAMTKVSDGVYTASVQTTKTTENWYKFYKYSAFSKGASTTWDDINPVEIGCRVNGDNATTNFVVWTGDKYKVQTPIISGAGKWVITLDMNNLVYTVSLPVLYMAGDVNGWVQAKALMLGNDGNYTGYIHVTKAGFKFTSQENWNGTNYGYATDSTLSTDGGAGNLSVANDGVYYAKVNTSALTYKMTEITAISLIGTIKGNWDTDVDMTYDAATNSYSVTADLAAGDFKFRMNHDWNLNLGGTADALSQNGSNIPIATAGNYTIKLYPSYDGASYCTITKN